LPKVRPSQSLTAKLGQLETEKARLQSEQRAADVMEAPELHPNLPELYRRRVAGLEKTLTLTAMDRASASEILRSLISGIIVFPGGSGKR
jgi:hypothetical protein